MEKKELNYRCEVELKKAISYLGDVLSGLRSGTVTLQDGTEQITVKPPTEVGFSLKAQQKEEEESISIKLSWTRGMELKTDPTLVIRTDAPQRSDAHKVG